MSWRGGMGWMPAVLAVAILAGNITPGFAKYAVLASADLRGPVDAAPTVTRTLIDEPNLAPSSHVVARVDLSDQRMYVYVNNQLRHVWPVSTGGGGYITPTGYYKPDWSAAFWRSKKYNNAPMPWSVFFHEGYAIHGTTDLGHLGKPASHGCVRLHPDNAKIFYQLVQQFGMDSTLISVVQ